MEYTGLDCQAKNREHILALMFVVHVLYSNNFSRFDILTRKLIHEQVHVGFFKCKTTNFLRTYSDRTAN